MKKTLFVIVPVIVLALLVSAFGLVNQAQAAPVYGHPIYVWNANQTVLLDVQYKMGVGYTYAEIEAAFYTFATQACGGTGEPKCWHGSHVGILKNTVSTPKVVTGFFQAPDGTYHLIDVSQCLEKDGCVK